MIILMRPGASQVEIENVEACVREVDLEPHVIYGPDRKVITVVGDESAVQVENFSVLAGVERVVSVLAKYKLASVEARTGRSVIGTVPRSGSAMRAIAFGGSAIPVIAGPCTVEGREQVIEVAEAVKAAGAVALRGGAFKPRTSPYAFQGLEEEGLEYLAEARERTGLPIVTEVMTAENVPLVAKYADVLQIGARNMQNYNLLRALGAVNRPVLLKRGMSATLDELLLAAEYILMEGNPDVILCERGVRTFETYSRNTLALSAVPALKHRAHLPVVVDPSHGTGYAYMVEPMSLASVAAGADGLLIEVHADPHRAFVDGGQTLDFKAFEKLMAKLRPVAEAVGRSIAVQGE
jgi:3-deoxy-7-phosphoheptulonate synthase